LIVGLLKDIHKKARTEKVQEKCKKEPCRPDPGEEVLFPGVVGDRGDFGDPDPEVRTLRILPEG